MDKLIEDARLLQMTDEAREAQKRSFAYGTAHIENDAVTRAMIDQIAEAENHRFAR